MLVARIYTQWFGEVFVGALVLFLMDFRVLASSESLGRSQKMSICEEIFLSPCCVLC